MNYSGWRLEQFVMTSIIILGISFFLGLFLKLLMVSSPTAYKVLRNIHFIFLGLALFSLLLMINSYSFRGFYTDKMFVILTVATGMLLFGIYRLDSRVKRAYYALYFLLPFLLVVGLVLPRLQFITAVVGVGLLLDADHSRHRIDDTYSLQARSIGILSGLTHYSLVEKKCLILEREIVDIVPETRLEKSIKVAKSGPDSFRVEIIPSEFSNRKIDTIVSLRR